MAIKKEHVNKQNNDRGKKKLKEKVRDIVFLVLVAGLWCYILYDWLAKPIDGYYKPDYVNSSGELVDADDDGNSYHWYSIPTK